ncbi:MAG: hypothetical protein JW776_14440 [Candidatus Lokiarchaeota archaeon]|nr:hypothetical protein [Candidatus Lokiarchaeota archaeon]
MSDNNDFEEKIEHFWDKKYFKKKENRKKAGKASAKGGIGYVALAFFLGYIFLEPYIIYGSQVEAGFAFAVFSFLSLIFAFCGLFVGCYYIFFLPDVYAKALSIVGLTGGNWLTWIGFYPVVFIGCLINFGLIIFLIIKFIQWIVRKR